MSMPGTRARRAAVASLAQLLLLFPSGAGPRHALLKGGMRMRNQARAIMRAVGCLWIVVTTTVVAQPRAAAPAQDDAGGGVRYELQPSDVLQVSVWREPELTQQVIVRPDGAFSFPLVGEVNAVGKTVEELRKEIVQALARIIPDVVVTVA